MPAGVQETMTRNFARPFSFPGRIPHPTFDDDYSTTDSSLSDPDRHPDLEAGQGGSEAESEESWEGRDPHQRFAFTAADLVEEHEYQANHGANLTAMQQWEKDVWLRQVCSDIPDEAIMPEDHARQIAMGIHFGALCNRSDWWGWYPLHHAAFKGLASVCRQLVQTGADIDCVNRDGCTPIMVAARYGRLPACKMLLALGANAFTIAKDGETLLDKALRSEHRRLGMLIYDLFVQHRDALLSDGRRVEAGMASALSAAPSTIPATPPPDSASTHPSLRRGEGGEGGEDPRLLWRPMGWNWRDIRRQQQAVADLPEVQAYKDEEEWRELMSQLPPSQRPSPPPPPSDERRSPPPDTLGGLSQAL